MDLVSFNNFVIQNLDLTLLAVTRNRDGLFCEYAQHKGVRGDVDMAEVLPRFVITHLDPSLTAATYDVYAIVTSPWTKSFVFPFST